MLKVSKFPTQERFFDLMYEFFSLDSIKILSTLPCMNFFWISRCVWIVFRAIWPNIICSRYFDHHAPILPLKATKETRFSLVGTLRQRSLLCSLVYLPGYQVSPPRQAFISLSNVRYRCRRPLYHLSRWRRRCKSCWYYLRWVIRAA